MGHCAWFRALSIGRIEAMHAHIGKERAQCPDHCRRHSDPLDGSVLVASLALATPLATMHAGTIGEQVLG